MSEEANDRVTITIGRKVPVEQYGNFELRIEYSADKLPKESASSLIIRVESLVRVEYERLMDLFEKGNIKKGGKI